MRWRACGDLCGGRRATGGPCMSCDRPRPTPGKSSAWSRIIGPSKTVSPTFEISPMMTTVAVRISVIYCVISPARAMPQSRSCLSRINSRICPQPIGITQREPRMRSTHHEAHLHLTPPLAPYLKSAHTPASRNNCACHRANPPIIEQISKIWPPIPQKSSPEENRYQAEREQSAAPDGKDTCRCPKFNGPGLPGLIRDKAAHMDTVWKIGDRRTGAGSGCWRCCGCRPESRQRRRCALGHNTGCRRRSACG